MTEEQQRIVDAGNAPPAGRFPTGLSRDELIAWMKTRFGLSDAADTALRGGREGLNRPLSFAWPASEQLKALPPMTEAEERGIM